MTTSVDILKGSQALHDCRGQGGVPDDPVIRRLSLSQGDPLSLCLQTLDIGAAKPHPID